MYVWRMASLSRRSEGGRRSDDDYNDDCDEKEYDCENYSYIFPGKEEEPPPATAVTVINRVTTPPPGNGRRKLFMTAL